MRIETFNKLADGLENKAKEIIPEAFPGCPNCGEKKLLGDVILIRGKQYSLCSFDCMAEFFKKNK